MGNSSATATATNDQETNKLNDDSTSTVSLNGSNYKEKVNTSWKFSSANDDDDDEFKEDENLLDNNGKKQQPQHDEDDEKYDSTECYDDANDDTTKKLVTEKTSSNHFNLNSILHIDDTTESHEDYLVDNYQNQMQTRNGLNLSSTSTTDSVSDSSLTSTSSPSSSNSEKQQLLQQEQSNKTEIDNLAYNLLSKLNINSTNDNLTPTAVLDLASEATKSTLLNLNEPPAIPPSTPVSADLTPPVGSCLSMNENEKKVLKMPQLIIDDVILSTTDDRLVVPLAQEEQSFNSVDNQECNPLVEATEVVQEESSPDPTVIAVVAEISATITETKVDTPNTENNEVKSVPSFPIMNKLLNEIAHLNLIEYNFEYECDSNEVNYVNDVKLTGSFNNWSQQLTMSRDATNSNKWFKILHLAAGDYEYKFVINDNDWKCNTSKPTRGINNVVSLVKAD